jgi:cell division protein FtsQ
VSSRSGALRRRRKPSLATRLRIAWVFIVVIVGVAAYAGYVLVTLPQLRVQAIDVQIDGIDVAERDVLDAAKIDRAANMWLLDTATIARRIESIPYVDLADVRRALPADMTIIVTEREPVACVRAATRVVTIDRSRRLLQNGCARPSAVAIDLHDATLGPLGSTATAPALATLMADSRALEEARVGIRSIHTDADGGLVAVDRHGIDLLLGSDDDLARKAQLVGPVLAAIAPGRSIKAIDLRAPATPTVEYR